MFVMVVSFKNTTSLSDTQPTVQVDFGVSSSRPKGQLGVRIPRMWPDEQQPEVIAWYLSVFRTNCWGHLSPFLLQGPPYISIPGSCLENTPAGGIISKITTILHQDSECVLRWQSQRCRLHALTSTSVGGSQLILVPAQYSRQATTMRSSLTEMRTQETNLFF